MASVLMISGSYPPMRCGVGDYAAGLARALARAGRWSVRVLTAEGAAAGQADDAAGVQVLPLLARWTLSAIPRLLREVKRLKPDVVHMHFPTQGYGERWAPWMLPVLLRLAGERVVQTWHEYIPRAASLRPLAAALAAGEVVVVRPGYAERIPWPHRAAMRGAVPTAMTGVSNVPVTRLSEPARLSLRRELAGGAERLVGFFGFVYPHKRVELLFDLLDPATDRLLIVGELDPAIPYHGAVRRRLEDPRWASSASCTGFVQADRAADLLAACDVVALPFAEGGGEWNSSLHAARSQGTFVVTTSTSRRGYDPDENTFYAAPGDVEALRGALARAEMPRRPPSVSGMTWEKAAQAHDDVYARAMGRPERSLT